MLHRTYFVLMPTSAGLYPTFDLPIEGPVGSPAAPVKAGGGAGYTSPPQLWDVANGDGQYCEWRGNMVQLDNHFGDTAFSPRFRLGWSLSVHCVQAAGDGCLAIPCVQYSQSLVGNIASTFGGTDFADPIYGRQMACIRLLNTPDVQGSLLVVHLVINDNKDEDRASEGR